MPIPHYLDYLARRIGYKSYNHYLGSAHWRLFSSAMKAKRCFCCGRPNNLEIHHVTYERLGEEWPTDVETVCGKCHREIHKECRANKTPLEKAHLIIRRNKQAAQKTPKQKRKKRGLRNNTRHQEKQRRQHMHKRIEREKRVTNHYAEMDRLAAQGYT